MRFHLTNIEIARGVANRLRGALKDRGYARTHTKRLAAVSAMLGYASWSDLGANCPTSEAASPFDGELDNDALVQRAASQAQALARSAHIPLGVAVEVVAEVRPTSGASGSERHRNNKIDDICIGVFIPGTREEAFDHFTAGIRKWWPQAFTFSMATLDEVVLQPAPGGRWYEKSSSGEELDWGVVVSCDFPHRIVMTFQISASRTLSAREEASEVSIEFFAQDGGCAVQITHYNIQNHGDDADKIRANMGSRQGWPFIMDSYARTYRTDIPSINQKDAK